MTVGQAITKRMKRLGLQDVDAVKLEGHIALIFTIHDPVLKQPLNRRKLQLLRTVNAERFSLCNLVRVDSPVRGEPC